MPINRRKFIVQGASAALGLSFIPLSKATAWAAPAPMATGTMRHQPGLRTLRRAFVKPPDTAKPACYWWWFNNLVNRAGITRDLTEFKDKGFGGVLLICSANGYGGGEIPQGAQFLSPEWKDLFRHALQEANRLGLEVGVNLCGGWAMGGPWIKPEFANRWLLQAQTQVTGPRRFHGKLPLPGNRDGYDNAFAFNVKNYVNLPLAEADYRDTSVVAFKEAAAGASRLSPEQQKDLAVKSNRFDADAFIRANKVMDLPRQPWKTEPDDAPISPETVVDLTRHLQSDGTLTWDVPPGTWTILRTGHRMTGARTVLALPEADGLEVNFLSEDGVAQQFQHFGSVLLEIAGPLAGKTLKYFHDDSFEDGYPNWTADILEKFTYYRGYDPRPYLPVLAGRLVGSAEISDRFLHDYRKTVADLMADGHYRKFAQLCHENGLEVQNEAAGPSWSGTMCQDGLKNLGRSDRPMGEFWQDGAYVEDGQNKVAKMAASAAHLYGKKLVSAEGFTSFRPHWSESPEVLRPTADRAFCEGINRIVVHTSTATRPEDGKPGYEYAAGTHFNPNITWWPQAGAFLTYLSRCQYLLQQGLFVADVLYYNGDWAPNLVAPKHVPPGLGRGYDYDVCNEEILLTRLRVKDGLIVLPDGMQYRLLVLPDTDRMPAPVARKLQELVKAGATVVGPKPNQDPGLQNHPHSDAEVRRIAAEVWGNCDGKTRTRQSYGQGRIYWGESPRQILLADGIAPDLDYPDPALFIDFIHRTTPAAEIYLVHNRQDQPVATEVTFRVQGRRPELWDPVSGQMRALPVFTQSAGRTTIPLEFLPLGSWVIVFPKPNRLFAPAQPPSGPANFIKPKPVQALSAPWRVAFDPAWGGPASATFTQLTDWRQHPDPGIKHYSGAATYYQSFDLEQPPARGTRLFLDLGSVKNIARVKLNGQDLGVVWTAPWRVEITTAVKRQGNELAIEVINLWPNRLIGDAALPPEQRRTRTNVAFKPDAPLLPSGLVGPVTIQASTAG